MATSKKTAGTVTLGGIILVAVILGSKLLGGPDLTGLLRSDSATAESPSAVPSGESVAERASPERRTTAAPEPETRNEPVPSSGPATAVADETAVRRLIDNRISGEMVEVYAEVVKVLPDDNDGSRHQRLLLKLETGGTLLVAHNIDLAERVPVTDGEWITVFGQYEWNDRGGVLHWTHHDPKDWREGGWIEHAGVRYE